MEDETREIRDQYGGIGPNSQPSEEGFMWEQVVASTPTSVLSSCRRGCGLGSSKHSSNTHNYFGWTESLDHITRCLLFIFIFLISSIH